MKNLIKVSAVIFGVVGISVPALAAADRASQVFSWSGSVPASSVDSSIIIKNPDGGELNQGILAFKTSAGKGVLTSSSELKFNVFNYSSSTVGTALKEYTYELTSIAVNTKGLAREQNAKGYFAVEAGGTRLVKGESIKTGGETVLTVVPSGVTEPSNQPVAGEDVNLMATIVVKTIV